MAPDWSPQYDRRSVLRAGSAALATSVVVGLAGCLGGDGTDASDGDSQTDRNVGERVARVPTGAGMVTYTHVTDLLTDPATEALLNVYLEQVGGPQSLSAAREQFNEQSPVPLGGLHEAVYYNGGWEDGLSRTGFLLWTDWAESNFVDAVEKMRSDATLTERQYSGHTLYVPEPADEGEWYDPYYAGVLGDGAYVLGAERAVKGALDVAAGKTAGLQAALRSAFASTRGGPYQFAVDVPRKRFEEMAANAEGGGGFGATAMAKLSRIYGSVYVDGDVRGVATAFDAVDEQAAGGVRASLETTIEMARDAIADENPLQRVLERTSVTQSGATVTVRYEATVSELESLARDLASFQPPTPADSGDSSEVTTATPTPPAVTATGATGTVADSRVEGVTLRLEHTGVDRTVDLTEARLLWMNPRAEEKYRLVHESRRENADGHYFATTGPTTLEAGATTKLRVDLGSDTSGFATAPVGTALEPDATAMAVLLDGEADLPMRLHVPETVDGEQVALDVETGA